MVVVILVATRVFGDVLLQLKYDSFCRYQILILLVYPICLVCRYVAN
jgi:hypothetical protein